MSLSYRTDPAWADVTPIPQDDGPDPVVPIAYSTAFMETMDYFRAILARNELSPRALSLTADVIEQNSANYTAWAYRRRCLLALHCSLPEELEFAARIAFQTPKNYQLWHHRRAIVDIDGQLGGELQHTVRLEAILALDAKNYHVWAYRQWLVHRFSSWSAELPFVDALLDADVRNNSAWNHRYFVHDKQQLWNEAVVKSEVDYAFGRLSVAPNNESPWNYLTGLLLLSSCTSGVKAHMERRAVELSGQQPDCHFALALLVDLWSQPWEGATQSSTQERYQQASKACSALAESLDIVRREYWLLRQSEIALDEQTSESAETDASNRGSSHHSNGESSVRQSRSDASIADVT